MTRETAVNNVFKMFNENKKKIDLKLAMDTISLFGLSAEELKAKFDEAGNAIKRFINNYLVPAITAAKIPFDATNEIAAENIYDAILNVHGQVKDAASGTIVNGSVTKEKLGAELLARVYGGRPWVSVDTPSSEDNTTKDLPVGQVWLRPQFTVTNVATGAWTATACNVAVDEHDVTITGTQTVATANAVQNLYNIGVEGDRVFILFDVADKDAEISSMTVSINGAEAVDASNGGVFETQLMASGGLGVQFNVGWPSTSLADGGVTISNYTVVNTTRILRQLTDAKDMEDWAGYLRGLQPLGTYHSAAEVFMQISDGNWWSMGFDVLPVNRGGTGLNSVENNKYLKTTGDGGFRFMSTDDVVADLGAMRCKTGSYVGNKQSRTIDLGVSAKMVIISSAAGPRCGTETEGGNFNFSDRIRDLPIVLNNGAQTAEWWYANKSIDMGDGTYASVTFYSSVKLSDSVLTFGFTPNPANAAQYCYAGLGNRQGITYNWTAFY